MSILKSKRLFLDSFYEAREIRNGTYQPAIEWDGEKIGWYLGAKDHAGMWVWKAFMCGPGFNAGMSLQMIGSQIKSIGETLLRHESGEGEW